MTEGTKLTHEFTVKYGKPSLIIRLDAHEIVKPEHVLRWFEAQYISILNVARPRESKCPGGIYSEAFSYLERVFLKLKESA